MEALDSACQNVMNAVEGAVACGVVDLASGIMLGLHTTVSQPLDEVLAAATIDFFRPGTPSQQPSGVGGFDEVHITTSLHHHFAKTIGDGAAVLLLVTDKRTSIGMGWAQLKSAIAVMESLVG